IRPTVSPVTAAVPRRIRTDFPFHPAARRAAGHRPGCSHTTTPARGGDRRIPVMPPAGLSPDEVERSRSVHGANVLTPPPRDPWWRLYLEKFDDPVIRILLVAAAVSVVVGLAEGHFAEGVGIVLAVLLATGLAFWNELRAAK